MQHIELELHCNKFYTRRIQSYSPRLTVKSLAYIGSLVRMNNPTTNTKLSHSLVFQVNNTIPTKTQLHVTPDSRTKVQIPKHSLCHITSVHSTAVSTWHSDDDVQGAVAQLLASRVRGARVAEQTDSGVHLCGIKIR